MQDVACCIVPFQAYLQDDGDLIQALERIQCFRLSSMFLVMSPQLQFSHVVCLREIWPSPEKVWAGARHWESLWNKPRETPAREVLWDPSGLPNRAVLLLGCIKSHYFVKFQNKSNSINPKVWFAVYAVMFVIFLEKPQCKENLFFLAWNEITTGKQSDERNMEFNCHK